MKKIKLIFLTLIVFIAIAPLQLKAESGKVIKTNPTEAVMESARSKELLNRLDEIKALDKSNMNSAEKKESRKEVREIKRELNDLGGGVYLSVGAVIVILLLLIILL